MAVDASYRDFIKESLIRPIRSVLIVDDDYPTIDELLSVAGKKEAAAGALESGQSRDGDAESSAGVTERQAADVETAQPVAVQAAPIASAPAAAAGGRRREKEWISAPEKMKAVIDHFRELLLLVDVHDGSDIDDGTAPLVDRHLHQSDLLILDYHLDETDTGDKAIKIARAVASNDHFNMVVVNTRHKLAQVFEDMLLGLLAPQECFERAEYEAGESAVAAIEDDHPEAADQIKAAIAAEQYFLIIKRGPQGLRPAMQGKGEFGAFKAALDAAGLHPKDHRNVLFYALGEFQKSNRAKMAEAAGGPLDWNEADPFWIRSDKLFMAFSDKAKVTEPLEILLTALCSWAPPPSRLILAKFRAEMEAKGVSGESKAVGDTRATAHWYLMLLRAGDAERRTLIEESISRHAEQLVDDIALNVHTFADTLSGADRGVGKEGYVKRVAERFGSESESIDTLAASFASNAVACSKPAKGWHLRTGHVFEMAGHMWVCLTPICDMVPGQKRAGHRGEVGARKPFIGVKLHLVRPANYDSVDINTNNYLFLKIGGDVRVYSLLENAGSEEQPHWYMLYADENGQITPGEPFNLSRIRDKEGALTIEQAEAKVVGELRYEYAINLMQKLGVSMTRVGLDFTA